jgi:DNA polymerase/3'-5' exonuclease PolX
MFDAKFFRSRLPADAKAAGAGATVELHLLSGQGHRVRSVVEALDGYVVLEVHRRKAETAVAKTHWEGEVAKTESPDVHRAVVAYESIAEVVVVPPESVSTTRIGFGS